MFRKIAIVTLVFLGWLPARAVQAQCIVTTDVGTGADRAFDVAIQPSDGKVVLVGLATNADEDIAVVRYNIDGSLDTSFDGDGMVVTDLGNNERGRAVAIQSDGKIVVAGFNDIGGVRDAVVLRYNTDGSLDTSFDTDGFVITDIGGVNDAVRDLAIQSDGKILVAGFGDPGADLDVAVLRYDTDGSLDTSFDTDGIVTTAVGPASDRGIAMAIQSDGRIVVTGRSDFGIAGENVLVVRYDTDGSLDTTFNGSGKVTTDIASTDDEAHGVSLQRDGKIVVGGFTDNAGNIDLAVLRYTTAGVLDTTFNVTGIVTTPIGAGTDQADDLIVQPNGNILAVGLSDNGGDLDFALTRYRADGTADNLFDGDGKVTTSVVAAPGDRIEGVALYPDGRIVAAGTATIAAVDQFAWALYQPDGTLADCVCTPTVNYRSLGTNSGDLANLGNAFANNGATTVTFDTTLPANIGVGDELTLDIGGANEIVYIFSRDSETQVTLQSPTGNDHSGGVSYQIRRAFRGATAIFSWEANRDGLLVSENRREVGVAYNDGLFAEAVVIDNSTTDSCHFMHLTVAPGQRHTGVAGTGVVMDGEDASRQGIRIRDDYTIVEWFEFIRHRGANGINSVHVDGAAGVRLNNLLVHDFVDGGASVMGIMASTDSEFTVRNSIIYDGDSAGIRVTTGPATGLVENCTVFGMAVRGIYEDAGLLNVTNSISMNSPSPNIDVVAGAQSYNITADGSAAGPGSLPNWSFTDLANPGLGNWVMFRDLTPGVEDLHLRDHPENDAQDGGEDLTPFFWMDVDGDSRINVTWDIGADETGAVENGCPEGNWWDCRWKARRQIFFRNDATPSSVLTDFPVLVCLDGSKIDYARVKNNGEDLRFLDQDNFTVLPHEIEEWNEAGTSYVWVRVPRIENSDTDFMFMYFDNVSAGDGQNPGGVWDSDFKMVQHLQETSGAHLDSTGNGNDTVVIDVAQQGSASGQINGADSFLAASADHLDVADSASLTLGASDSITVEAWVQTSTSGVFQFVASKKDSVDIWQLLVESSNFAGFWLDDGTNPQLRATGTTVVTDGGWHYLVGRWEDGATTAEVFVDGQSEGTDNGPLASFNINRPLVIGQEGDVDRGNELDGNIDEVRFSLTNRTDEWIKAQYECMRCNFLDFGGQLTTEVALVAFEATGLDGAVELEWRTGSELNNLGFHLYRAETADGAYQRITPTVIPGLGSSPAGAGYRYRDGGLDNGRTYFYRLEDIETTGKTTRHGPVGATPRSTPAGNGGGETEKDLPVDGSSLITYGDPSRNRLRILERAPRGLVLELLTEGFYAEPHEDGTVSLSIPGFEPWDEAEAPPLPVKRPWIDAIPGRLVAIQSVRATSLESVDGLRLGEAETKEIVASRRGTVRGERRARRKLADDRRLLPREPARLLDLGYLGPEKKAQLELAPLRWDGRSGQLLLARRIVVRLSFDRVDPEERLPQRRRRERALQANRAVNARLHTRTNGIYRVGYRDLFRGGRAVPTDRLSLSRLGTPVSFHIVPDEGLFGPGSVLYFLSGGADENPYGSEAVYELGIEGSGRRMAVDSARPSGAGISTYRERLKREENRLYQAALTEAPDLWLWDVLLAPVSKAFSFQVRNLRVPPGGTAPQLSLWLQGVSDFDVDPDHHLRVSVNGTFLEDIRWDGKKSQKRTVPLPPGVLREGENRLELENLSDTGAAYSMVMLDRFEVEYSRASVARDGVLSGAWDESGTAEVTGLGSRPLLLDVTDRDAPRWLSGSESASDHLRFRAERGRRYLVQASERVARPEVVRAAPAALLDASQQADYLVIGPADFLPVVAPLVEHRKRQGLASMTVALEEIANTFGYGEMRPEAIREFISYAYHHWRRPTPGYVLLLGDASYDFKDFLETGVQNRLPPLMVRTSYLWTVSDPTLAAVNGDDPLPDLAIGRLPAANAAELAVMVEKILAYETGDADLEHAVVLVTDDSDPAGDFVGQAREIAGGVFSGRSLRQLSVEELGASTRGEIATVFDEGASLVSYIGHGGIHLWAEENIFDISDVPKLSFQSQQPILLTMNCLNGYFHFPYFNSLAEELVKAEGRGAIAAFSPSGLSLAEPAHRFHQDLLDAIFNQGHRRLGDAVVAAQASFVESGAFPELVTIYHLLGDPALRIR